MSLKVVACAAVSLIFFTTGCGPTALDSANLVGTPAEATPTPLVPAGSSEVLLVSTAIVTTASLPTAIPSPVPVIEAMPIPTPAGSPFSYHIIEEGESLSYISWLYDTPIEQLVAMNRLAGPEAIINTGQSLRIPLSLDKVSPQAVLLPDSEVVYGPAYVDFDLRGFIENKGGYLVGYTEHVDGQQLSGPEIVERVAQQFSVGPRLHRTGSYVAARGSRELRYPPRAMRRVCSLLCAVFLLVFLVGLSPHLVHHVFDAHDDLAGDRHTARRGSRTRNRRDDVVAWRQAEDAVHPAVISDRARTSRR